MSRLGSCWQKPFILRWENQGWSSSSCCSFSSGILANYELQYTPSCWNYVVKSCLLMAILKCITLWTESISLSPREHFIFWNLLIAWKHRKNKQPSPKICIFLGSRKKTGRYVPKQNSIFLVTYQRNISFLQLGNQIIGIPEHQEAPPPKKRCLLIPKYVFSSVAEGTIIFN